MAISRNVLGNILHRKNSYCCLCLQAVDENDTLRIQDEILYENKKNVGIREILDFLLDSEARDNLMLHNSICRKCTKDALESYKFIKMCRENSKSVKNTINAMLNSLPLPDQIDSHKSVFLDINIINFTSFSHLDVKGSFNTSKRVLKRFRKLLNRKHRHMTSGIEPEASIWFSPKLNFEDAISIDNYIDSIIHEKDFRSKQKVPRSTIPSSEMRIDNTFKCKMCLRTYESLQKLRQHFLRVHAPKKCKCPKCPKCPKSYGSNSLLRQHIHNSHTPVVCAKCGKSYGNRHTLRLHEMGHNTKIMCPDCGRYYKHQKTFNNHVSQNICKQKKRKSNYDAPFTCDHCNKKFSHKGTLRVHIQFEHGSSKAHVCPWCNKKFCAISRLKEHTVKHTKEKNFVCVLCGEKFVTKHSLLYHTRIHTGDKPYQCHMCESRFISSSRRADHVRRHHTSATMFECEICHSKLKGMSSLAKHKKKHFNPKSKLYFSVHTAQKQQQIEN